MNTENIDATNSINSTKNWAWIGRIGAVVACIWAVFQLYGALFPKEPKLQASYFEYNFQLPPHFALSSSTYTNIDGVRLAREIQHITTISIHNSGEKPALEMILGINDPNGIARIDYDGRSRIETVTGSLDLGELRQDGVMIVTIWGLDSPFSYYNEPVISYSDGTVHMKKGMMVYGFAAKCDSIINFTIQNPFLALLLCAMFTLWLLKICFHFPGLSSDRESTQSTDHTTTDKS